MSKETAQTPDFNFPAEPFALVSETAIDHERRQREERQRQADRASSARRQSSLFDLIRQAIETKAKQ